MKPARLSSPDLSRIVTSNQDGIHPDLEEVVKRHLNSTFQKPIPEYAYEVLDQIEKKLAQNGGKLILDSGCGTGASSINLSDQFPDDLIVGIDQSIVRLNKKKTQKENVLFFRASVIDIWSLMQKQDWKIDQHFLLYPNPWPKKKHLKRRWHGHPVFPSLLKISKSLELRTNWKIYAEEFAKTIEIATTNKNPVEEISTTDLNFKPISPFEKKYLASGQKVYSYRMALWRQE
ncbi:MAG: tRNA (guanosine(46)-N(7))-methyltransferase TrmB [Gammaproteobacteria bacterium]